MLAPMPTRSPTPDQIEAWLEALDGELATVQSQIEPLLELQTKLQERRILLKDLLGSFGDTGPVEVQPTVATVSESTRERVHRQAVQVLKEVGRPLHSNDLQAEFNRRGYEIPGLGKPNNITVHLTGWADIASPARGYYGLTEHVGESAKPAASSRRRKRRTR